MVSKEEVENIAENDYVSRADGILLNIYLTSRHDITNGSNFTFAIVALLSHSKVDLLSLCAPTIYCTHLNNLTCNEIERDERETCIRNIREGNSIQLIKHDLHEVAKTWGNTTIEVYCWFHISEREVWIFGHSFRKIHKYCIAQLQIKQRETKLLLKEMHSSRLIVYSVKLYVLKRDLSWHWR